MLPLFCLDNILELSFLFLQIKFYKELLLIRYLILFFFSLSLNFQGNLLDEASGVKKAETSLVITNFTPKHSNAASWNKKVRLTFWTFLPFILNNSNS